MTRPHRTKLGFFEVRRTRFDGLKAYHAPTGLSIGGFSHLKVRTIRDALAGLNAIESRMSFGYLESLSPGAPEPARGNALYVLEQQLRAEFPNGAWSR